MFLLAPLDADFEPSFVKVCAYFPYPAKVWLNGHEWAKRQATMAGIGSPSCRTVSPAAPIRPGCRPSATGCLNRARFFDGWTTPSARAHPRRERQMAIGGNLSMRQIETSRTLVFDQPRRARAFFEALVADNLDVGRPDHVEVIFAGHSDGGDGHRKPSRPTRPGSTPEPRSE